MENNNNDRSQNSHRFPRVEDGRLRYHWGVDDRIMRIIKKRYNSPETQDSIETRIEMAKPGNKRHHYNDKVKRQILVTEDRRKKNEKN